MNLPILVFMLYLGLSPANIVLVNNTGLRIARIEIDDRRFESTEFENNKLFISVTPELHHLKLVFRGGAQVDWPKFDFEGVHEIIFERIGNKIKYHSELEKGGL